MKCLFDSKIVSLSACVFVVVLVTSCSRTYPPLPEALDAMKPDETVDYYSVTVVDWDDGVYHVFTPQENEPAIGFVFYPGAFVDPRSYAPSARAIAAAGYLVVVVSMPFDFAELGYERADQVLNDFTSIDTWAIGGHSMGGKMVCKFIKERNYPDAVGGVVLWASRPSDAYRLDETDLQAVSLYGTNDGIASLPIIEDSRNHLPQDTAWVEIEGGNHTQFGYYDTSPSAVQRNDKPADITREQQQKITVDATIDFLDRL